MGRRRARGAGADACTTRATTSRCAQGDEFVIALPANPSTGYAWTAGDNPDVTFVSSHQVQGGSQPGAPGTQELAFRADHTGAVDARARVLPLVRARRAPGQDREVPGDGEVAREIRSLGYGRFRNAFPDAPRRGRSSR